MCSRSASGRPNNKPKKTTSTIPHNTGIAEQVERILKRNPKFSLTRAPSLQPITRVAMLDRGALGVCCVSSVASVGVSAL